MTKKHVIAGLGEIGKPIMKLLSEKSIVVGYDVNPKLRNKNELTKYSKFETMSLHICIPFTNKFIPNISQLYKKFKPQIVIIHSTVSPYTTKKLQSKLPIPVIYSATRGVHKRMLYDLKRYTKFFAMESKAPNYKWASSFYYKLMKQCGVKTKKMSSPITLELAKIICDTSYLGWLVNYAQISNMIAMQHGVNYNEMWSFSDEIHKTLGNRPKMFPGFIGGHCVIPNLGLIHNQTLDLIKKMNIKYAKKVKNTKKITK